MEGSLREPDQTEQSQQQVDPEVKVTSICQEVKANQRYCNYIQLCIDFHRPGSLV